MKQHVLMLAAVLAMSATVSFANEGAMMDKPMDKDMTKPHMEKPMDVSGTLMKNDMDKPMKGHMEKKDKTSLEDDKYHNSNYSS